MGGCPTDTPRTGPAASSSFRSRLRWSGASSGSAVAAKRPRATLQAIAEGLNRDGIPSPTGRRWRHDTVGYVLDNPKYRGAVEYLFTWTGAEQHVLQPGTHQAIIG